MVRAVRQDRQMISEYVALYFKRVLAPTFRLTDVLGVLLPPIIAAYQAYRGTPMLPDSGQDAFVFIGYIAVAVLGLRILATPYLLWRDDQAKIGGLTQRINDLEDIPASGARDAAREARKRLAHDTATILSIAQQWISQPHLPDMANPWEIFSEIAIKPCADQILSMNVKTSYKSPKFYFPQIKFWPR
ncbi:MAG: hypothetical protein GKR99_19635 [Rhodobacteraceae bacterium]|nr:hypothetical protein [Paracoccaceae bacterium]